MRASEGNTLRTTEWRNVQAVANEEGMWKELMDFTDAKRHEQFDKKSEPRADLKNGARCFPEGQRTDEERRPSEWVVEKVEVTTYGYDAMELEISLRDRLVIGSMTPSFSDT
jgi:hypothetical protein